MTQMIAAVFPSQKAASKAVSELKSKGYDDISVIAKDSRSGNIAARELGDLEDSSKGGVVWGGVLGGIFGVVAGVSTVTLPGIGSLIVAGPLTALWGLGGGALGALAGGLLGGLQEAGISADIARHYTDRIQKGEVFVAVAAEPTLQDQATMVMERHGAEEFSLTEN